MRNRYALGVVGSLALMFGVFAPLVLVPIAGSQTYLQNGRTEGAVVLALGAVALFATLQRQLRYHALLGTGALGVIGYTFVRVQKHLSHARDQMNDQLGNAFRGLTDALTGSVKLQWGWAVLGAGAILLIAAGIRPRRPAA